MSHTISMSVQNKSSQILSGYNVSHSWNDNNNSIAGENLAVNESSKTITITTGYGPQHDNYKVDITFGDGSTFNTGFYCDSSQEHTSVVIEINNNNCNCVYYTGSGVDTGCYNKG